MVYKVWHSAQFPFPVGCERLHLWPPTNCWGWHVKLSLAKIKLVIFATASFPIIPMTSAHSTPLILPNHKSRATALQFCIWMDLSFTDQRNLLHKQLLGYVLTAPFIAIFYLLLVKKGKNQIIIIFCLRLYLRLNYIKLPDFIAQSRLEYWEFNMFNIIHCCFFYKYLVNFLNLGTPLKNFTHLNFYRKCIAALQVNQIFKNKQVL